MYSLLIQDRPLSADLTIDSAVMADRDDEENQARSRSPAPRMTFGVLGPLVVTDGHGGQPRLPGGRARIVLAALCAEAGREISRDRLIDITWNGAPPATAVTQLHGLISALRRSLGSARDVIVTRADGYLLEVEPDDVDLARMRRLVLLAQDSVSPQDAAGRLAEVLDLWRGRPFAGLDCVELLALAERVEQEYVSVLEAYAHTELLRGNHEPLVKQLAGWVPEYPFRESLRGSYIVALARSGRQADAIAAYHQFRRLLAQELGVDPGQELQRLYQRVLAGLPDLTPPGGVAPAQLPAAVADFAGRAEQVSALRDALTGPGRRPAALVISAVSGIGGIGKSTLAVHVAHAVADDFPDGQFYVNLSGTSAEPAVPAEVLGRLLRDLGVQPADIPAEPEERAARYRSLLAGLRLLVVLDDARDAAQVRALLPGARGCAVIVTSRAALGDLPGAGRLELTAMDDDEARDLLARIVGAARLDAEPEATSEILRACAGLPLAIRIVAAKLVARPGWTVWSVAERLTAERDRLTELRFGDLAVRASFGLSYQLLGPAPARAFRLLGLSPSGTLGRSAAAALVGPSMAEAQQALDALTEAYMLEAPRHDRFQLHDLLRLFAADLAADLDEPERTRGVLRLVTWYARALRLAAEVLAQGEQLPSVDGTVLDPLASPVPEFGSFSDALQWCQEEQEHLAWAVRSAAELGRHDIAAMMAALLWMYASRAAHMGEFLITQQIGLESARKLGDISVQGWLLAGLGDALSQAGQPEEAAVCFRQALALRQQVGRRPGIGAMHNNLGTVYHEAGRCADALIEYGLAAAIYREEGQDLGLGVTLANEADCLRDSGDYDKALTLYAAAADALRRTDYLLRTAEVVTAEGETLRRLGRLAEALDRHRAAVALNRRVGTGHRYLLTALDLLARTLADLGQTAEARACWEEAADLARAAGDPRAGEFRAHLTSRSRHQ
jgi:DNA-binding SARP family transcriptional activator